MCGIAGIVNTDGRRIDSALLAGMLLAIDHRGPDGSGIYQDSHAGLGHVRLSIIDRAGGRQPMHNEDRSLWITFNGEIFNYVELMDELKARGHVFASKCDTEVIVHAYEEWGEDCVKHFNGQWAFAIWDHRQRRLFASRDRLGVRPFFYTALGSDFLFASEIKSLFQHPGVAREVDFLALDQIFTLWSTLPPRTIFRNIFELPPGHSLLWSDGAFRVFRHWQVEFEGDSTREEEPDTEERLIELLVDATRLRLRSDVPVGAYLSGGLDSSLTSAIVRRFTDVSLATFSVTFDDPQFDESSFQREVVAHIGTDHRALRCSYGDIGRVFPDVIRHAETPILRTAPAPMFLLSRLVRDAGYKVVVTGEGADEMFGGYDIFKEAKVRRFWGRQSTSQIRPQLLKRLYPYLPGLATQSPAYLQAFFNVRPGDIANPFFSHLPRWELTARLKTFFSADMRAEIGDYDVTSELLARLPADYSRWEPLQQAQYLEITGLMPGYILSSQGDRMAMANAVEGRFPFLDYRVAAFAAKLPVRSKLKGLREKDIVKRIASKFLPESVVSRPKQPYRAPDSASFFGTPESPLAFDYADELLSRERIADAGIFDPDAVARLVEKARRGQARGVKDNMALVGILSTQLVVDRFIGKCGMRSVEFGMAGADLIKVGPDQRASSIV